MTTTAIPPFAAAIPWSDAEHAVPLADACVAWAEWHARGVTFTTLAMHPKAWAYVAASKEVAFRSEIASKAYGGGHPSPAHPVRVAYLLARLGRFARDAGIVPRVDINANLPPDEAQWYFPLGKAGLDQMRGIIKIA